MGCKASTQTKLYKIIKYLALITISDAPSGNAMFVDLFYIFSLLFTFKNGYIPFQS